ncbi:MAG: FAD binding domain-containing protein [Candidatus Cloacimonetes bacterium]|jgi:xanthine dehydrogenase small subunit|nr:FAD binding domain-containing protein [Candidatus Cloacimonadota bacterium]MCB5286376.1 FAD binding domain-containing protein [Candidatus Cloacimonadota bacterium]MCK9184367.1 FAD binding domain-containing protein [Candidatus Cloacimonadota bacterium]MCK9585130.1 FAD binding domain-containing protein [Candidatus Cloacimonadota bacterium]MDY0228698.1 FAD binding domain-containing protein [Candidatus Cloacimonadaceae bacterium]
MTQEQKPSGIYRYNRISFYLNGRFQEIEIAPGISTLDLITKQLHLQGTKCSCNEGDCGACTVVIAQSREGSIVYEAITSCLYPAAKLHGKHLITVEGLGSPEELHPIQQALLDHHGTQCGYCTPGFVMSLFALLASVPHPDQESILAALEGNLCRCTGYQSILAAAEELSLGYDPSTIVPAWCRELEPKLFAFDQIAQEVQKSSASQFFIANYLLPADLSELKEMLAQHPEATLLAGGTDIMVQVNVLRKHFDTVIDLGNLSELRQIKMSRSGIHIGAAVSYSQIMDSGIVNCDLPELVKLCRLIASKQIRNFGTLAGNIGNASPIGDSLPLLLVYGARLVLSSQSFTHECALRDFFIGYRLTALDTSEFIREIIIPIPPRTAFIKSLKTAKRRAVDISSVVSAIRIDEDGKAALAFGGVAAQPVFSESFASGYNTDADWQILAEQVAQEFTPLSDVRGSADYRKQMIINHILQYQEAHNG